MASGDLRTLALGLFAPVAGQGIVSPGDLRAIALGLPPFISSLGGAAIVQPPVSTTGIQFGYVLRRPRRPVRMYAYEGDVAVGTLIGSEVIFTGAPASTEAEGHVMTGHHMARIACASSVHAAPQAHTMQAHTTLATTYASQAHMLPMLHSALRLQSQSPLCVATKYGSVAASSRSQRQASPAIASVSVTPMVRSTIQTHFLLPEQCCPGPQMQRFPANVQHALHFAGCATLAAFALPVTVQWRIDSRHAVCYSALCGMAKAQYGMALGSLTTLGAHVNRASVYTHGSYQPGPNVCTVRVLAQPRLMAHLGESLGSLAARGVAASYAQRSALRGLRQIMAYGTSHSAHYDYAALVLRPLDEDLLDLLLVCDDLFV